MRQKSTRPHFAYTIYGGFPVLILWMSENNLELGELTLDTYLNAPRDENDIFHNSYN